MASTVRGVYHDLRESEYTISNGEIVFSFSSRVQMNRFLRDYEENRMKFHKRLAGRKLRKLPIHLDMVADVILYKETEVRGFRAVVGGVEYDWERMLQYALGKGIRKNTTAWQETQKQS